jgi:hypothetical protein
VRFARGQAGSGNATVGVKHLHGVGAPGFAGARGGAQSQVEAGVANSEVLSAVVKRSEGAGARSHAAADARAFFKHRHGVPRLYQSARASDGGDTCTNDGNVSGFGHTVFLQLL